MDGILIDPRPSGQKATPSVGKVTRSEVMSAVLMAGLALIFPIMVLILARF